MHYYLLRTRNEMEEFQIQRPRLWVPTSLPCKDNKQNRVWIVLDSHFRNRIINTKKRSDRIIVIKLAMDNQPVLNIVSAYAHQVGCNDVNKELFGKNWIN